MPKKLTHIDFVHKVKQKHGDMYNILSSYHNSHSKVLVHHKVCGYSYTVIAWSFMHGHGCPKCAYISNGKSKRLSHEKFLARIKKVHGSGISVLGNYDGYAKKILVKHEICGSEFLIRPQALLKGHSCKICQYRNTSQRQFLTHEEFLKKVQTVTNNEYTITGKYVSSGTKISIVHELCGSSFMMRPASFLSGQRCPCCSISSKFEKEFKKYLIDNGIPYSQNYKFELCKAKRQLPFDFCIFDVSGSILVLIELDGIHHYKPVPFFGTDKFKIRKEYDAIKTKFCIDNNIRLIRLPYFGSKNDIINGLKTFREKYEEIIKCQL